MTSRSMTWLRGVGRNLAQKDAGLFSASSGNQWRRKLRHWLPALGWPGIVAIGMLAICLAFYFSSVGPMQQRRAVAQHKVDLARMSARTGAGPVASTPAEELEVFYNYFPPEKKAPLWLEKLASVAEANGLKLNIGEYKVSQDKAGPLIRLRIALPVQGRYPQIRNFLASLTTEIPVMALENVQFERNKINESAVKAKVKLILYLVQES